MNIKVTIRKILSFDPVRNIIAVIQALNAVMRNVVSTNIILLIILNLIIANNKK